MFETVLEILKFVFGDFTKSIQPIKQLKGDSKKRLFKNLIRLFETLSNLEKNVIKIKEDYVKDFIYWLQNDKSHTLESYCGSVKNIYLDSAKEIENLLDFWNKKDGIRSYLLLRDENNFEKMTKFFAFKGKYVDLLIPSSLALNNPYTDIPENKNKVIPYISFVTKLIPEVSVLGHEWFSIESITSMKRQVNVEYCNVENIEDLEKYLNHLENLATHYSRIKDSLKKLILDNFEIEDYF